MKPIGFAHRPFDALGGNNNHQRNGDAVMGKVVCVAIAVVLVIPAVVAVFTQAAQIVT